MDKQEAKRILEDELAKYRPLGYAALQRLLSEQDNLEIKGASGAQYQIEIIAVWDSREGGDLRVLGSIDDGGLRAFVPLSSDLIIRPDNTFVGD
jgi:hypothetical protein